MLIKSLRLYSYKSWKVDNRDYSKVVHKRLNLLKKFWKLKEEGASENTALEVLELSRATLYRWQTAYRKHGLKGLEARSKAPKNKRDALLQKSLRSQVLALRTQFPAWGRKTLCTVLKREKGIQTSESTVGRILKKLIAQGKVKPVSFYRGILKKRRPRTFHGHARAWHKKLKSKAPGEMIQIDHMSVNVAPGVSVKHFEATCPKTKWTVAQAYRNATSQTAAEFLDFVIKRLPFPLKSIQVDGGSEFMKNFEKACASKTIPLYVLPPRSPELNGCVERRNRTLKMEFYALYNGVLDFDPTRRSLQDYMKIYNTFRPHYSLQQDTPLEYYNKYWRAA